MGIKVAPEFDVLASAAIGDTIEFIFDELIDVLVYLPEALATIIDGLSSSWPLPGVFDDSLAIPHPLTKDSNGDWTVQANSARWFNDVDVSAYAPPNVPSALLVDDSTNPPTAVTSVPGDTVGRNAFLGSSAIIAAAIVALFGVKQAGLLIGKVYVYFFGISAKVGKLDDKVDSIIALLEQPDFIDQTESGQPSDVVLEQLDVIKHVLRNADGELSGLITGLLTNRRAPVNNVDWTEGIQDSRSIPIE